MSNTINPNFNLHQVQQREIQKSAYHRGDVGNMGKTETKVNKEEPSVKTASDSASFSGKASEISLEPGVKKFEKLENGTNLKEFDDGIKEQSAPNGMLKEFDDKGNMDVSLPNGYRIEHDKEGQTQVYDPGTGLYLKCHVNNETPEPKFTFKDQEGNKWQVDSGKMSFNVENRSETLKQSVDTDGSMKIHTKTLSRDPVKGIFTQDEASVKIDPQGNTEVKSDKLKDIGLNNEGIKFTARDNIETRIKFPYQPSSTLKGDHVQKDIPLPPPQMQQPDMGVYGGIPGMGMPGFNPNMGMPGFNPGMGMGGIQQFPFNNAPPTFGFNGPVAPHVVSQDPYAPAVTPNGMIRENKADGSMFISMPNGIVISQTADGILQAFDANTPPGSASPVLPVTAQEIFNPGWGKETVYNFRDGSGNFVTVHSKSLDVSIASADGTTMQNIAPNGDILTHFKTPAKDKDGNPTFKLHQVMVGADGRVNTFGERGIQMDHKTVTCADSGNIFTYKLPYPIPPHQGMMPGLPFVNFPAPGNIPVQDPTRAGFAPAYGPEMYGFTPPPANYQYNPQSAPMGGTTVNTSGEPVLPPGFQQPKAHSGVNTEEQKTEETKSSSHQSRLRQGKPAGEGAKTQEETPTQKPLKKGVWQRIKDFFTGESNQTHQTRSPYGYCQGGGWTNPYPCGYYNPYGSMATTGAAIGLGIGLSAMMAGAMMPMYPMGMYYSPFSMMGWGMW